MAPNELISATFVEPLGEERYEKFFAVRDAFETGGNVAFGSDWASTLIPDPNAFFFIQSWVTRIDPQIPENEPLNMDQAKTLEQAVKDYTQGGAQCLGFGWEDKLCSIEAGKLADESLRLLNYP